MELAMQNKDTSIIPKGDYCYIWTETPSHKNNFCGKVKHCPYYEVKNIEGVQIPWCSYLELGGRPGDGDWAGWEDYEKAEKILTNHFGSEPEKENKLSLFLLFDSCKECGVNNEEEYEN